MAVSKRLRYEVLRRDGHACRYCGMRAPEVRLTIDHVIPVALGGTDAPDNLVPACVDCNSGKSSSATDAALIAVVSNDAMRWAEAMKVAADAMVASLGTRDARRAGFRKSWQSWTFGEGPAPLPDGWGTSVDRFLSAGLPKEALADCVSRAMETQRVMPNDKFRYMCGIAWARIDDLQRSARASVGAGADDDDDPAEGLLPGRADLARELLGDVDDERAAWIETAQERLDNPDYGEPRVDEVHVLAIHLAWTAMLARIRMAQGALLEVVESHPSDRVQAASLDAQDWFAAIGDENPQQFHVLVQIARILARGGC